MKTTAELEALQNAVNSLGMENISINEWITNDRRKSVKMYFLQDVKCTISPTLDYEQMNHFILGMNKMKKMLIN